MVWRAILAPYLARANCILDLGAGTGRFSILMADWFDAFVIGVEPAASMRQAATATSKPARLAYLGGRAEHLPFRERQFDAALLSNVFHHIEEPSRCALELYRVLKSAGCVLVRGSFPDRPGEMTMFDHFPEARRVFEQFAGLDEVLATFDRGGFACELVQQVVQQTCSSLKELAARTRLRADTTLALLPDEIFFARQAALEQAASSDEQGRSVVETLDFVVLRKAA